jgi:hypothetical protein
MRDLIVEMANRNIGSLCLFLKNQKNIDYLEYLNNNIPHGLLESSLSERIYYFVNNVHKLLLCDCGNHLSFIGFKNGYRSTCGDKICFVKKRKETCIEKWGVDNPLKSKEIIDKTKENILKKWGGLHYMCNEDIREKFKTTMMKNHGVEWAQQSKEISEKSKLTWNSNPDRFDIVKKRSEVIKNKSDDEKSEIDYKKKETLIKNWGSVDKFYEHVGDRVKEISIEKWGVVHHLSHPDIIKKRVDKYKETITNKIKSKLPNTIIYIDRLSNTNNSDNIIKLECLVCSSIFDINRQYLVNREKINNEICLNCNPRQTGTSLMEKELLSFIEDNYIGDVIVSDKKILNGKELDIFLPELNLAFEFNGLYWHSELYKENSYHQKKSDDCLELGIQLIHIWEDDWLYKNDIVKSIILNKLNISNKLFARKCDVREVNNFDARDFLNRNHIQGFVGSKYKIGLYYDNELVSLMTFGSLRKSLGQKTDENVYELLRFCNKIGYSVIGGASKLLKNFLKNNNVKSIISYSDNSRGVGNLYKQLGFLFIHQTQPNYYYVIGDSKSHRFNFRKDKLVKLGYDSNKTEVQIMNDRGFYRIFDCGSKKWEYTTK